MPTTVEQIVQLLNAGGNLSLGPLAGTDQTLQSRMRDIGGLNQIIGAQDQFASGQFRPENLLPLLQGGLLNLDPQAMSQAAPQVVQPTGENVLATPLSPPPTTSLVSDGTGELNIPFGSDFLPLSLDAFLRMSVLSEGGRQFDQTASFNAAMALANLRAQGPQSAAELALAQSGLGLDPFRSGANTAGLLGTSTRGAGGSSRFSVGGFNFDTPNTLGGQQLAQGSPNTLGVLGSFAKAAGNPDLIGRSIRALLPSGFQPTAGTLA